MNKTIYFLISAAAVFSHPAWAQENTTVVLRTPTEKGGLVVGSNLLFSEFAFAGDATMGWLSYSVGLSPRVGYFVRNDLALGLQVNAQVAGSGNNYFTYTGGLGFFGRYYFGKSVNKKSELRQTRFFLEAGASYSQTRGTFTEQDSVRERFSAAGANYYLMPGVDYFINKNVAVEGGLNFSHTRFRDNNFPSSNNVRTTFHVGLQIFFAGRRR